MGLEEAKDHISPQSCLGSLVAASALLTQAAEEGGLRFPLNINHHRHNKLITQLYYMSTQSPAKEEKQTDKCWGGPISQIPDTEFEDIF